MDDLPPSIDLCPNATQGFQSQIRFSPYLTALCLLICLGGFVLLLWSVSAKEVELGFTANRDLERLASRLLSFESRLADLSSFEQSLFHLWGEKEETQMQIRQWYEELPKGQRRALDEFYVGILNGETGMNDVLQKSISRWESKDPPFPVFTRLLEVGYLEQNGRSIDYDELQGRLAEQVPANWFYYQLAERLAFQADNQTLLASLRDQFQHKTDPQLWKWRVLILGEVVLGGLGLICLVFLVVRAVHERMDRNKVVHRQGNSPWTFHEGLAVLVRGGALSILIIVLVAVIPYGENILEDYGTLFLYVPTVGLAIGLLCRPKNQSLLQVLGCRYPFRYLYIFFPLLLSVIGLGLIGDWMIMFGGNSLEISVHWTEWFLPQLVWGSSHELFKTIFEVVVLAPIFEEIIFRGMVFTTLRVKFGTPIAIVGSALIFALAHGYGPMAFLTVFWSGLLWAWLYARTGSLIPSMCAHALNNGMVVYFLLGIFR